MRKFLTAFSFFLFITLSGFSGQRYELPEIPPNNLVLYHTYYTIDYSQDNKDPIWCAEELTHDMTQGPATRPGKFKPDPLLPGSFGHDEYTNSGYDRGHQVPAADMKISQDAMNETFYTTNICPQYPTMNQQDWEHLEELVRAWTSNYSCLYVVTGPIFEKGVVPTKIGKTVSIAVPQAYFKVILIYNPDNPADAQAIGFIMRNEKPVKGTPLHSYAVPVCVVEAATGIKFFAAVPEPYRTHIIDSLEPSKWQW